LGILACAGIGGAAGVLVWWVVTALRTEDLQQDLEWRYDVNRVNALRRIDPVYRLFQPLVQFLAKLNRAAFRDSLPHVARLIQAAGLPRFWLPEEYLARCDVLALLLSPVYFYVSVQTFGAAGVILATVAVACTSFWFRQRLSTAARVRLTAIKRRLPFFLDLLTLLMEAGASFLDSLNQAVREFHGHPVAVEFGRVLADMNLGKARVEAFDNLRQRLADDEIASIVASMIQGEKLGTPLSHIFRTQSDLLRVKRTQRAETIAGEAAVKMLLPGVLVMAAAVLIILGPFALNYFLFGIDI
jgi:tight adherence protein C